MIKTKLNTQRNLQIEEELVTFIVPFFLMKNSRIDPCYKLSTYLNLRFQRKFKDYQLTREQSHNNRTEIKIKFYFLVRYKLLNYINKNGYN